MSDPKGDKRKEQKSSQSNKIYHFLGRFFSELLKAIKWEFFSTPGRVNIVCDLLLAVVVIIYILSSTVSSVARIIASIFNQGLTEQAGDSIIGLLLILVGAFMVCVFVVFITRKENEKLNKRNGTDDEE